jgi:AraC family transcriptional regulator
MDSHSQSEVANRTRRVEFLGAQWDLLGRITSERGVQVLAIQGMPNGRMENRLTADMAALAYSPRRSRDAKYRWGRKPFRSLRPLSLITSGCSFKMLADGPFTSSYCVLSANFLAGLAETEEGMRTKELNLSGHIESERLTYLGQEMLRESVAPGFAGALFAEAMGMAVAAEIARLDGMRRLDAAPRGGGLALWQMRRLDAYIRDHLSDKVTLYELALLIGVSVRRLSHTIKASLGVSLHEWVAERRLAEARRLLIETNLPIGEVGRRCAFQSVPAFMAAFRTAVGCAPGAFRRMSAD